MFAYWLAGALLVTAARASLTAAPPAMLDVTDAAEDDVKLMLGRPDRQARGCRGVTPVSIWRWSRVDWLGARRTRVVIFTDGIADTDKANYEPGAESPFWLDALRDAFGPRP